MDADVKTRWVTALRSGEYEQGNGQLREQAPSGKVLSCCLDVLCDLAVQDDIIEPAKAISDTDLFTDADRQGIEDGVHDNPSTYVYWDEAEQKWESEVLPKAVYRWAGLTMKSPAVTVPEDPAFTPEGEEPEHDVVDLTELNDTQGWSFDQIADAIEADADL